MTALARWALPLEPGIRVRSIQLTTTIQASEADLVRADEAMRRSADRATARMRERIRREHLAGVLALFLAACSGDVYVDVPPARAACPVADQDDEACTSCGDDVTPIADTPELDAFGTCYDGPEGLAGEPTTCAASNPSGAEEWRAYRDRLCDACAASCCYFCSTAYGRLDR